METVSPAWRSVPEPCRASLQAVLLAGERLICAAELDLDSELRFADGLIVLTDRRILSAALAKGATGTWQSYPIATGTIFQCREHAGSGKLELMGPEMRLAVWRYSANKSSGIHRLLHRFDLLRHGEAEPTEEEEWDAAPEICPSCGSPLPPGEMECPSCTPAAAPPAASSLWRLARFAKPRMKAILVGFILSLVSTGIGLIPPYLTKPLIDDVLKPFGNDPVHHPIQTNVVTFYLLLFAAAAVLTWLIDWARTYVLSWVSERIAADLRNTTYEHLQKLSLEFFGGRRTGDLMSRLSTDTDRICYFLSVNLLDFGTDMLTIALITTLLIGQNFWLAMATLVPLPLIAWLVTKVRNQLGHGFAQGGRAWAEMTSVLADTIPGVRVVKAFAQENREVERFRQANDKILLTNDRVNAKWSFFWPLVALLTEAGVLIVWITGIWQVQATINNDPAHQVTVGTFTVFLVLVGRIYVRLESISRIAASTQRAAASSQRIFEILDRVPSVAEPLLPIPTGQLSGAIQFNQVGFKYGSRPIIQGVTLQVKPGEMIGLVGPSGSGKSTLVNLVCRFYDVGEGAILVDGHDIRSFGISDYRRHIGIVLQEPFLFFGTIMENIAYGRPDATREEILAAAKAAKAHDFILRLPDGYDSLVGERGQSLSGGERQRISIARALLIDPAILILDEATSAVDTETEREIQEALDFLIQGRTTIAIAHRLSTLRKADRIVVLERGKVVETGKHQELLDREGAYYRLHQAQMQLAQGDAHAADLAEQS